MPDLEQELRTLARTLEWPGTPAPPALRLGPRRRRSRRPAWVAVALIALSLAVAFAVPSARSAILRVFHVGGVTIERVRVLPPAEERSLAAGLGPIVDADRARLALGTQPRLPAGAERAALRLSLGIASVVFGAPQPVLFNELHANESLLKKVVSSGTSVRWVHVGASTGIWIAGHRHVVIFPAAPTRLAGNVLIWQSGQLAYRLEGAKLTLAEALRIARTVPAT